MHLSTWDNRLEKNLFFIFDKRHEMNVLVHPNHQESLTRILLSIWMFQYIQEVPFFDSDEYIPQKLPSSEPAILDSSPSFQSKYFITINTLYTICNERQ